MFLIYKPESTDQLSINETMHTEYDDPLVNLQNKVVKNIQNNR